MWPLQSKYTQTTRKGRVCRSETIQRNPDNSDDDLDSALSIELRHRSDPQYLAKAAKRLDVLWSVSAKKVIFCLYVASVNADVSCPASIWHQFPAEKEARPMRLLWRFRQRHVLLLQRCDLNVMLKTVSRSLHRSSPLPSYRQWCSEMKEYILVWLTKSIWWWCDDSCSELPSLGRASHRLCLLQGLAPWPWVALCSAAWRVVRDAQCAKARCRAGCWCQKKETSTM